MLYLYDEWTTHLTIYGMAPATLAEGHVHRGYGVTVEQAVTEGWREAGEPGTNPTEEPIVRFMDPVERTAVLGAGV